MPGSGGKRPARSGKASLVLGEDALIIVCLRSMVLFPGVILPLSVGRKKSVEAVQEAVRLERPIGLLLQKEQDMEDPRPEDLYKVGTVASVLKYLPAPDGSRHIICQGQERFRVLEFIQVDPFPVARVERIDTKEDITKEIEARFLHLKEQAREAIQLLPHAPPDLEAAIQSVESPSVLADMIATYMDLLAAEKQDFLETLDLEARLEKVSAKLAHRLEVLRLSREISQQTKGSLEKAQREYYLREQLKTIHKELGEEGGRTVEVKDLAEAITRAKMPPEAEKEARKELSRLERMPEAAAEYSMIRTYIDWLIELPWSVNSDDVIEIRKAREILEEEHFGLAKVKKRILEFLAVRKLKPDGKSAILCLVGPPGVGKTSLGQSVARAMNRKFVRISLGGVHDEAEIRGHRRTYIGALPGTIIQSIRRAGTLNPVFMLDEIDKVSSSYHGDPASALLEVLDPEQNNTFRDNYLGVPFDLSRIVFIATANVLDTIPGPLRDRCEIIQIPGYTEEEKLQIARRYLVRRRLEENGLKPEHCEITDDTLRVIIRNYTREAGCRNLEREIGAICRNVAARIAEAMPSSPPPAGGPPPPDPEKVVVRPEDLHAILGPWKFESEIAMRTSTPGVATGMAWTPAGGEILFVEAARMPGKGNLVMTGQLGDVMKESAQAAITLVKSHAAELEIDPEVFEKSDIHIHIPAGAIPKDGPSAGVTIYTALVSLLCGRTARSDVAMTGEISLRGLVLPIGGIKEKVIAARNAGIKTILLPARNQKDLEEIPEDVRGDLHFVLLERVEDAIQAALGAQPAATELTSSR
ncbi:MAG TPA: endopeptidase La [Planctomycetota bacterium]|nr:endopeptidase La [Planctomycetota bacterium]